MQQHNDELELTEFEKQGLGLLIKLLKYYFDTVSQVKLEQLLETVIMASAKSNKTHTTLAERRKLIAQAKELINKIFEAEIK